MTRTTARRLGMHAIGACALLAVWALPAAAEEEVPARPQAAAVAETPPPVPALKPAVPRAASERGELPLAISLSFAPDSTGLDGAARLRLSEEIGRAHV